MKAGMVVQIRINPADCQSILDLMGLLNIDPYDGRSFAVCTSAALSSMLGMLRKNGTLPEPDPFQYMNRMAVFQNSGNSKRKTALADQLYRLNGNVPTVPGIPTARVEHPGQYFPQQPVVTGWTENGPVSTAAAPMQMDEETRNMLFEEYNNLNERLNNREKLTPEEKERYTYLDRFFCG